MIKGKGERKELEDFQEGCAQAKLAGNQIPKI